MKEIGTVLDELPIHSIEEFLVSTLSFVEHLPMWPLLAFLYFAALAQTVFGFVPGDVLLMLCSCVGGVVALPGGAWTALAVYYLGTFSGSVLMFEIGRKGGKHLLRSKPLSRILRKDRLRRLEKYMARRGAAIYLVSKFIPGINTCTLILGGILGVPRGSAYLLFGIAALVHNTALFLVGRAIGSNLPQILLFLNEYTRIVVGIVALVLLSVTVIGIIRHIRKNGKEDAI